MRPTVTHGYSDCKRQSSIGLWGFWLRCRMDTLGKRIRLSREAAKLSQSDLATAIGISSQSVNQWESGSKAPSRKNLIKAARILNAPLDWLLYGGERPERDANGIALLRHPEGRSVPARSISAAIAREKPQVVGDIISTFFPCGPESYWFRLPNASCAPEYPAGTIWVVDPDQKPGALDMVLAAWGVDRQPIFGRLSYETTAAGIVLKVTPLDSAWPGARSDLGPIDIIAVMTESIRGR